MRGAQLGSSIPACKMMLSNLEGKFMAKPELKKAYSEFMTEYEHLGHMEKVEETYLVNKSNSYCLPHHGVVKESTAND